MSDINYMESYEEFIKRVNDYYRDKASIDIDIISSTIIKTKEEEREKAIKAYKQVHCRMGKDLPCEFCSFTHCKMQEFEKLLNE